MEAWCKDDADLPEDEKRCTSGYYFKKNQFCFELKDDDYDAKIGSYPSLTLLFTTGDYISFHASEATLRVGTSNRYCYAFTANKRATDATLGAAFFRNK